MTIINLPGGFSYTFVDLPLYSDVTITIEPPTDNTITYYYFFATEEQKQNPTLFSDDVPPQGTGKTIVNKTTDSSKSYLTFTSVEPLKNMNILIQSKKDGVYNVLTTVIKYALVLSLIIGIWALIKKFSKK